MNSIWRGTRALFLLTVLAEASCAPDLRVDHPFDGLESTDQFVTTEVDSSGVTTMHVNATNKASQIFVDLDLGRELKTSEAFSSNAWDLSFKRFEISTNGGAGNPDGTVSVAVLNNVDFDALTAVPDAEFQQDGAERIFSSVEGGWYAYDLGVHRLVAQDRLLYVVRTSTGASMKLKMLSYYDPQGTPAVISLKYAQLAEEGR